MLSLRWIFRQPQFSIYCNLHNTATIIQVDRKLLSSTRKSDRENWIMDWNDGYISWGQSGFPLQDPAGVNFEVRDCFSESTDRIARESVSYTLPLFCMSSYTFKYSFYNNFLISLLGKELLSCCKRYLIVPCIFHFVRESKGIYAFVIHDLLSLQ